MSAETCPVCGAGKFEGGGTPAECGHWPEGRTMLGGKACRHAERLAIERAAEIERLKAALASAVQAKFLDRPLWTARRVEQLEDLGKVLHDCKDLNRATHIIERLCRVSMGSESLTKADLGSLEPSFLEFLNTLCREDRRNQNQEN